MGGIDGTTDNAAGYSACPAAKACNTGHPSGAAVAKTQNPKQETARKDDNVVYIGKKGVMGYVLAVITNFNRGSQEVVIKARGHLISRAVDVEEIVKHRFMPSVKIKDIRIMTEELQSREGHMSKVSAMEIVLAK